MVKKMDKIKMVKMMNKIMTGLDKIKMDIKMNRKLIHLVKKME
jgi:hypothetical protein